MINFYIDNKDWRFIFVNYCYSNKCFRVEMNLENNVIQSRLTLSNPIYRRFSNNHQIRCKYK